MVVVFYESVHLSLYHDHEISMIQLLLIVVVCQIYLGLSLLILKEEERVVYLELGLECNLIDELAHFIYVLDSNSVEIGLKEPTIGFISEVILQFL